MLLSFNSDPNSVTIEVYDLILAGIEFRNLTPENCTDVCSFQYQLGRTGNRRDIV